MKCEVDGVKYKSKPNNGNGCNGCAGQGDGLCNHLDPCPSIIWVKVKPKVKVDGKTYKAVKETNLYSCFGCSAFGNPACHVLDAEQKEGCADRGIVWVEKVKRPVEPVKTVAWVNIYGDGIPCFHYETEQAANVRAEHDRIACVRIEY